MQADVGLFIVQFDDVAGCGIGRKQQCSFLYPLPCGIYLITVELGFGVSHVVGKHINVARSRGNGFRSEAYGKGIAVVIGARQQVGQCLHVGSSAVSFRIGNTCGEDYALESPRAGVRIWLRSRCRVVVTAAASADKSRHCNGCEN